MAASLAALNGLAATAAPNLPTSAASGTSTLIAAVQHSVPGDAPWPRANTSSPADSRDALFWAYDFAARDYYRLRATLVHSSDISRIFVEGGRTVAPAAVAKLAVAFEDQIYPKLRNRFGHEPEPGIDGQRAITLLLLDVRDPFGVGVAPYTYYAGYFDPTNQLPQARLDADPALTGRRSNELEMVYLDVAPTVPGGPAQLQTLAHEFAHLITWNYDADEETWLSEGLSELAVYVAGLGHPADHVAAFLRSPGNSLVQWAGTDADYGMAYLLLLYVYEQAELAVQRGDVTAAGWPRYLVENPDNGIAGLRDTLPVPRTLEGLFRDLAVALQLDDSTLADGRFGFLSLRLGESSLEGQRFPALATPLRSNYPIEEAVLEMAPWSIHGERWVDGPGPMDISLSPSAPLCAALLDLPTYRHPSPGRAMVRPACSGTDLPAVGWTLDDFRSGGETPAIQLATANASSEIVTILLSALPPIGSFRWYWPLHLPLAVR